MAAASIVENSKSKENVTLAKFDEKKETRKTSLAGKPSGNNVSARKLPPIAQQKNKTPSNQPRGKTVLSYTAKAPLRNTNTSGQQSQAPLQQIKKTAQFELKDDVPVAGKKNSLNTFSYITGSLAK